MAGVKAKNAQNTQHVAPQPQLVKNALKAGVRKQEKVKKDEDKQTTTSRNNKRRNTKRGGTY